MKRDRSGAAYDYTWFDDRGTKHFARRQALGTGGGPARWSEEHDCNPICGCHLEALCTGCGVCMTCDGCYCFDLADE